MSISTPLKQASQTDRIRLAAILSAYRTRISGGDQRAQEWAAVIATTIIDEGGTAATAIDTGHKAAMRLFKRLRSETQRAQNDVPALTGKAEAQIVPADGWTAEVTIVLVAAPALVGTDTPKPTRLQALKRRFTSLNKHHPLLAKTPAPVR